MSVPERLAGALADRYRIERELGQGGMATVYLADDLRHNRKVAVKVMRPELAAVIGADRFLAEITTTANLQHPHILPLFDSGTVEGTVFYVMPFVAGESLRDRLDREKQLPIDDAVRIATEVAGALHYAHEHGVIHRDIKPENILLHGGHALVADFGIALAAVATGGSRMTETGMSLGTPTYMSPEQAMGERALDARADIYALGCVLYEMLVGDPPHVGSTAQAVVAKVITEKPSSIVQQRDRVPAHVEDAVLTALEKLPADRFANAAEFAMALARADAPRASAGRARGAIAAAGARPRVAAFALGLVTMALLGASAGWLGHAWTAQPPTSEPIQFTTSLASPGVDGPHIIISPDGRRIVQSVADSAGRRRLMVRDLRTNTVTAIPGSEGGYAPAFSPPGDWLAFVADNRLQKVALQGGPAQTLLDSMTIDPSGVAWSADGQIFFSRRNSGLWRMPADGGTPVQLTRIDSTRKEFGHWAPTLLPGANAVIYSNYAAQTRIEAYEFRSKRTKVLVENATFARYSPTGHLLFARDGAVFAVSFDPDRLETRGTAVPVQDDVFWEATDAFAAYDVSRNGTFVYVRASDWATDGMLVWRDRSGRDVPVITTPGAYSEPRLSPDGRRVVLTLTRPKWELWLYDLERRVLTQLTRAPLSAFNAVWLPDSRRVLYTFEDPVYDLHVIPIDGSAPDRPLLTTAFDKYASSISRDGRRMLMSDFTTGDRLNLVMLDSSSAPQRVFENGLPQRLAAFSPDDRWVTFTELGPSRMDVFLQSLDGQGGRRLVSAGGGSEARWTKGGREIVYLSSTGMMSVPVDPVTGNVGTPTALFPTTDLEVSRTGRAYSYDVTPDGERFLVVKRIERPATQPVVVMLNWRPAAAQPAGAR